MELEPLPRPMTQCGEELEPLPSPMPEGAEPEPFTIWIFLLEPELWASQPKLVCWQEPLFM